MCNGEKINSIPVVATALCRRAGRSNTAKAPRRSEAATTFARWLLPFPENLAQRGARGVIPAHAVDAAARRSGSRTQINARQWRAVRRRTKDWSRNQLRQVRCAAVDVAAGQIRIRSSEISGTHLVAGEDAIAKTGRESLDLRFDLIRHIRAAAERNMAVRPERVLTARRSRFIEQTLLRDQHERALGNFSAHNLAFRRRDFVQCCHRDELCLRDGRLPLSMGSAHSAHNRF